MDQDASAKLGQAEIAPVSKATRTFATAEVNVEVDVARKACQQVYDLHLKAWIRSTTLELIHPISFLQPSKPPGGSQNDQACFNKHPCCSSWAANGHCHHNIQYMQENCKMACRLCTGRHSETTGDQ